MDLSRFSIDAALFAGADASNVYRSVFYEKLLAGLFENDENLYVRTDITKDRERIFAFPALYWLTRPERASGKAKVLYLCADESAAEAGYRAALEMAQGLGEAVKPALLVSGSEGGGETKDATLLFAPIQLYHDLLAADAFVARDFGFVVADQAEKLAELPGETMRKIQGSLIPSWERKTLVVADRHTPRAKNFAWDFADNPKEIKLGETMGYASTMSTVSRDLAEADKIRFILHLLEKSENRHLCVFCNLKSTAAELSARLAMNGVATDYIGGNLNPDRKNQIVAKALSWTGARKAPAPAEQAAPESEGEPLAESPADADETSESTAASPETAEMPETSAQFEAPAQPETFAAPVEAKASRFPADSFVLVLTDDGAKGATRPEFLNVVNYDIPLEPEFYFERLNCLKRQDPSALLYNLVCERYMYGIPAIEHIIDASLAVKPLEADIELPEDLSAGKEIEMPEPRFRGRGDRRGRDDRFGRGGRYGRDERHGERRDDYRDDRRGERRDDHRGERRDAPREEQRTDGRGGRDRDMDDRRRNERPGEGRRGGPRGGEQSRGEPRRREPDRAGTPDPYAMSMEERLAFYRQKYGKNLQKAPADGAAKDGAKDGAREGSKRGRGHGHSQPRQNANARGSGPRPEQGRPEQGRPEPRDEAVRETRRDAPARDADAGAKPVEMPARKGAENAAPENEKPRGFLGRLQDLFGSNKD